jgi:DNA-binding NtrC family response regulator
MHGIDCIKAASARQAWRVDDGKNHWLDAHRFAHAPARRFAPDPQGAQSQWANLPIIIMSGDAEVRDAIEAMHLSVVDFLLKPIDTDQLLKLIKRELRIE